MLKFLFILCIIPLLSLVLSPNADGGNIRNEIAQHKVSIDNLEQDIKDFNLDVLKQRNIIKDNQKSVGIAEANEKFARENKGKSWTGEQDHIETINKLRSVEIVLKESEEKLQIIFSDRNDAYVEIERLDTLINRLDSQPNAERRFVEDQFLIGITMDNTCKIFIKNNFSSNCPSFELLSLIYPDSSCEYVNHSCIDYYRQQGGFHYMIDPPASVADRIKMIQIRYNFEEFHIQGIEGYNNTAHTINYQVGRYLDGCKTAYIGADSWFRYTGDSIYLLYKGCDMNYTGLGGFRSESINQTDFDIRDFKQWQLEQWIKESLEKCKSKCFEY